MISYKFTKSIKEYLLFSKKTNTLYSKSILLRKKKERNTFFFANWQINLCSQKLERSGDEIKIQKLRRRREDAAERKMSKRNRQSLAISIQHRFSLSGQDRGQNGDAEWPCPTLSWPNNANRERPCCNSRLGKKQKSFAAGKRRFPVGLMTFSSCLDLELRVRPILTIGTGQGTKYTRQNGPALPYPDPIMRTGHDRCWTIERRCPILLMTLSEAYNLCWIYWKRKSDRGFYKN